MTSKNFFFRAMAEDIRHKIWMTALSVLGNFLVLSVGWMVWRSENLGYYGSIEKLVEQVGSHMQELLDEIIAFTAVYVVAGGGVIALAGAVIVGLSGFRYVFHRNMTDLYHSLPVKRGALYGISYLNGFLIWCIPFMVSTLVIFLMACSLMGQLGGGERIPELAGEMLLSMLVVIVVYLLVYHVVLLAVMLGGNALNTLVTLMIVGFGVIAAYGLTVAFFNAYLDTYHSPAMDMRPAAWLSPLFAAPYLIVLRMDSVSRWELWKGILILLAEGTLLGAGAWQLYRRRASEAAEQGIRNKKVAAVFRMFSGIVTGMCGWAFFVLLLSDSRAFMWGIFGAVLGSVCTFGILNIIFQMDFKAFFSHKVQMAGTMAATLLICFAFCGDWFGYDTYLPASGEIAQIAVYDAYFTNRYLLYDISDENRDGEMCYQDRESLYGFLERMTEHERENFRNGEYDRVSVKITLNNGRSYYRNYRMGKADQDVAWPIFTSEEYLRYAYLIDETLLSGLVSFELDLGTGQWELAPDAPEITAIVQAYNQDILEHPEEVLLREGRLEAAADLVIRFMDTAGRERHEDITMEIYDFMEHTMEAFQKAGLAPLGLEELRVESIMLPFGYSGDWTPKERVELAREIYGVYGETEGTTEGNVSGYGPDGGDIVGNGGDSQVQANAAQEDVPLTREMAEAVFQGDQGADGESWDLYITDPGEMEEVFRLLSFQVPWRSNSALVNNYARVVLVTSQGNRKEWYIPMGSLPEKYILRFGE